MQHQITLNDPWFDLVKTGQKKYEGRCFWKWALGYNIGDTLRISSATRDVEPFSVRIDDILRFKTFEEALSILGLDDTLPGVASIQEGVDIYYKFVSLKTQQTHGVCMIKVSAL